MIPLVAMRLFSAILTLLLVMDPIGNVPLFLSHLKDTAEHRRTRVVARESLIALLILVCFLLFGPALMALLHIDPASLHISGGVLLFLISVGMIFPGPGHVGVSVQQPTEGEPFIVPLATPFFAGPSTMATIMILSAAAGTTLAVDVCPGGRLGTGGGNPAAFLTPQPATRPAGSWPASG